MQWNMYCTCNVVHYSFFLFQATKTMKILFTSIVFILQIWIAQGRLINILNQMALKGESVKNAWSCHPSQNPKISEHLFQRFRMRANFNWRSSLQLQGIIKISLASHADRSNLDSVHFVLLSILMAKWQVGWRRTLNRKLYFLPSYSPVGGDSVLSTVKMYHRFHV